MAKKPTQQQRRLAKRARPKARRQRSPEEIAAVRAVRAWREGGPTRRTPTPVAGGPTGGSFEEMFGDLLNPMSEGEIDAESRRAAMAEVNASAGGIGTSMRNLRQQQQQAMAALGGLARNAGQLTSTIGPGIAGVYNQAAETQGNLAAGFSGQLRDTVAGQTAQDQAFLQNIVGAPAGQVAGVNPSAGGDAGNVLMGTAGLLPATALGQTGAAFASYGHTLPATVARMASQDAADLTGQFSSQLSELASMQAEAAAQMPAIQAEHRARMEAANLDKAQMARQIYEDDRDFQLQLMAAEQAMRALGMDQKKIDEEIRRYEQDRQDEIDRFEAEMGYQQDRDAVADAQWQYEQQAALAEDQNNARADRAERLARMRRAKVDLEDTAWSFASDLRITIERPVSGSSLPGISDGETDTVRIRPGWHRAMKELRKQYVKDIRDLRRMGVRDKTINQILARALKRAGYKRRRRRRGGGSGAPNLNPMAPNFWGNAS